MKAGVAARRTTRLAIAVLSSLLILALTGCVPQADKEQASQSTDTPLAACRRSDVQEVVGKETRSKLLKSALRGLIMQELLGVDASAAVDDFDRASVTFDHVILDKPGELGEAPYQQIVCAGHVQIDMSTATAGQQVIGIERLRWVINYSMPAEDPVKDAFTIDVDDASIRRGLTVNGRSPPEELERQQAELSAALTGDDGSADAQRAANDAGRAADEAAAAAREAAQAAAAADAEQQGFAQQSGNNNPPSQEDVYAPH